MATKKQASTASNKIFSVTVPLDLYKQLQKEAFERDEKLAQLVRKMIKFALANMRR